MKQYIRINGKEFSLEEIAEKLGIAEPLYSATLCQEVCSGTLCAQLSLAVESYPGVELSFEFPKSASSEPLPIARLEQDDPNLDIEPQCFLYGRGDSYIAYMDVNTQTDVEFKAFPRDDTLVVSGDKNRTLLVFRENNYINDYGMLEV